MPPRSLIIIHERMGQWARQLRPRLRGWPLEWWETRSSSELADAASRTTRPILVVDLADRPIPALLALHEALLRAPDALALILDPRSQAEVALLAREVGATLVLSGVVVPPQVETVLIRWLNLARKQWETEGWAPSIPPRATPEPWEVASA